MTARATATFLPPRPLPAPAPCRCGRRLGVRVRRLLAGALRRRDAVRVGGGLRAHIPRQQRALHPLRQHHFPLGFTPVAGLYQCRSDLPASVCTGCVRSAIARLSSLCSWSAGGAVQLRSCFVRYGNDSFVGKPNTAVLFKKCGGSPGDAGGAAMRDSALGGLASSVAPAGGGYRAGGAGGVQAMSQCVGDLDAKACSDCVSAAAAQLKAGCGYASAGEVYLGKCYARFWSNGGGFVSGASSGNGYGFVPRMHGERLALAVAGFFASLAYFSVLLV
ncbi:hypothetical protein CFC21_089144 [Triticum aestivum]|uniref:Gnk2-homologous domain-containing protein n=2 Tax=Triticum aestivum TaxID=4565 RepID=A0A9R1IL25_WHEAT|nr:hypothetical protein CFC21_089144 [Triticum aestivum]